MLVICLLILFIVVNTAAADEHNDIDSWLNSIYATLYEYVEICKDGMCEESIMTKIDGRALYRGSNVIYYKSCSNKNDYIALGQYTYSDSNKTQNNITAPCEISWTRNDFPITIDNISIGDTYAQIISYLNDVIQNENIISYHMCNMENVRDVEIHINADDSLYFNEFVMMLSFADDALNVICIKMIGEQSTGD